MAYEEKAKKIWQTTREAIEFRSQRKDFAWKELDAFDRGEQWDTKGAIPSWIPKPTSNMINYVKKMKSGELILENYLGTLKPLSPDNVEQIMLLQRAYEQLWEKHNLKYWIAQVAETSRLLGTGILYMGWDEGQITGTKGHLSRGEITILPIEPSTFFVDPRAFTIDDALFCGTYVRTTIDNIKADASLNEAQKKAFLARRKDLENYSGEDMRSRGEIFNRDYGTFQNNIVDLITYYEKKPNEAGGFTIDVTYVADGIIIKSIENIKPNRFPFVFLHQYKQRQDFWGLSDCSLILPNVKMINKIQSIVGTLATLYQNPQKVISEASGIDPRLVAKYGNAYGLVLLSKSPDLNNVIKNVEVSDIPATLINYMDFLKQDIKEFTGLTDISTGAGSGSLQTSTGVQSMIERSLVANQNEYTNFERFIEQVSYMLLSLAIEYYTDDRIMRLRSETPNSDFEYEYIPFQAEMFKDLVWDFSIDISSKLKHTEQSEAEKIRMLSEWQLQYQPDVAIISPEDIVRSINPKNRDILITRMAEERAQKSMENAKQIAQMIMQTMEQIQIETMERENALRQAQAQPAEGGGFEEGTPLTPEQQVAMQREIDPLEVITQIVYEALNPQKQKLGNVNARQSAPVEQI